MTREEIKERFSRILQEQVGMPVAPVLADDCLIAEDLGAMSLDMASIQMSVEDEFGLKFAVTVKDYTEIDRAWEVMKTVGDGVNLIEKFKGNG